MRLICGVIAALCGALILFGVGHQIILEGVGLISVGVGLVV